MKMTENSSRRRALGGEMRNHKNSESPDSAQIDFRTRDVAGN